MDQTKFLARAEGRKSQNPNEKLRIKLKTFETRKRGNCECIATSVRPSHASPFPLLITTPCQVWSRWTYPLLYYSVFAADTLLYAVTLTFDPVIFDLWPTILNICNVSPAACDVMKLCAKFERNRAIRGGVIAISVFDLMTLNIALRVALGSGIIFTKFDLRQLNRAWITRYTFVMLIRYVTLWPWPLTRWPWKFVVHQASCDQSLYEIWAKSSNHRLNYS